MLFHVYDSQLTDIIKPVIRKIGDTTDKNIESIDKTDDDAFKKILEFYKELKNFSNDVEKQLGNNNFKMSNYISWFLAEIDMLRKFLQMRDLIR